MNKKLSFVIGLFVLVLIGFGESYSQGMKFEEKVTWQQVLEKAKSSGKPIFVDAYTTWCGPCKWMAKNIFPGDSAGSYYNANYINVKMDMEKGEGVDFAKKYEVRFYPSYLFFDKDGNLVHRSGGSKNATAFVRDGKNGLDPNKQLITLEKKFNAGARDIETTRNYAFALMDAGQTNDKLAAEYLKIVPEQDKFSRESFMILATHSTLNSDSFRFLTTHKKDFTSISEDEFTEAVSSKYAEEVQSAGRTKDLNKFLALQEGMERDLGKLKWKEAQVIYYKYAKDFNKEFTAAEELFSDPQFNDASMLNSLAWKVYEKAEATPSQVEKARDWSKRSIEIEKNWQYIDTYASLLFRLQKYPEAKAQAEEAIKLAKEKGEDPKDTEALLAKINEKLNIK